MGETEVSATELGGARNDAGLPGRLSAAGRGPVSRRTVPVLPPADGVRTWEAPLCAEPACAETQPATAACNRAAGLMASSSCMKHACMAGKAA